MKINRESKGLLNPFITSNSHYEFFKNEDIWILDKNIKLNMLNVLNILDERHHEYFLDVLANFAITRSSSYTKKMFWAFYDYIKTTDKGIITDESVREYHSKNLLKKPDYINSIRVFFRKWFNLELPGVSENQVNCLYKGKPKRMELGKAIKIKDMKKGPFSDDEVIAFNEGAMWLYEDGDITFEELAMALITSYTGRRPIQTSHLKLKDVVGMLHDTGNEFFINYPRAKHSGVFRSEFTKLKITEDLHDIIVILGERSIKIVENYLGRCVDNYELKEVPLFIDVVALEKNKNKANLLALLEKDIFHIKSNLITTAIQKISKKTGFIKDDSSINARRFRYSLCTRAAQEGYSEYIIAKLLDHRSTRLVSCYVKNVPEYAERIDEVMTTEVIKYVNAFKGHVIYKNDAQKKIKNHEGIDSGNCSNCKSCAAMVPIPCYTCIYFKPWVDAPHQDVYDFLIRERKRMAAITKDIKIATSLDRTISAVREVVIKCNEIRTIGGII
ncbi:site-specific integrase [Escherichia coli]|uniref:site-specific integrase n=1 Tax=Escherichia coli TaxID=562 RepID=UPI0038B40469